MHFLLSLSLLCVYAYVGTSVLPFLLALAGGFALLYLLAGPLTGAPPMSIRRKLMMSTWSEPAEGCVLAVLNVNAEPLMKYLEKLAAGGTKVSVTTAVIKAVALGFRAAPSMNCRIVCGNFIPRDSIDISCLVALDDGKDLANAKIASADGKSLADIGAEIKKKADKLRKHEDKDYEASKDAMRILPEFVLKGIVTTVGYLSGALGLNIPALGVRPFPFGSCMITSVGMLGVEQAFVPFTPFARVPILFGVGEVVKRAVVNEKDEIVSQRMFSLTGTIDHRYADGTEAARMSKRIKLVLENPEMLDAADDTTTPAATSNKKASK